MRIVKLGAAFKVGLVVAVALFAAACGQKSGALAPVKTDVKTLEARIDAIPTEKFVLKGDSIVDIAAVIAAAPKSVTITYATVTFDAASGATVINQLRFAPVDAPDVGVAIDQLKVWGLDTNLAIDRLTGKQLDKTSRLARRIEATGVTPFGLEKFMTPVIAASNDASGAAVGAIVGADNPELEAALAEANVQLTKYDIGIGRIVIEDLHVRPWELVPAKLEAGNEFAELMPMLQGYAAGWRSFSADLVTMHDMKGALTFVQMGEESSAAISLASIGYRGFRGADTDLAIMRGLDMDMALAAPMQPGATPVKMAFRESFGRAVVQGSRLDKLLGYLARGVMPPRTDADLLSFGVTTMENLTMSFDGGKTQAFSVGALKIDLSKFQWFVPVRGRLKFDNVVYDIPAVMAYAQSMAPQPPTPEPVVIDPANPPPPVAIDPDAPQPVPTIDPAIMAALTKYGLDKPSFDTDFGWDWNPKTGALHVDTAYGLDAYVHLDAAVDLVLPAFQPLSDLFPEKGEADQAAISALFEKVTALKSASMNLTDEGGLDKGFALAVEIGKMLPAGDPSTAFLRNTTPENLRGIASNGAYLLADQAATQLPPAKDWLRPFAAWVTSGGAVHATVKPKAPIIFSDYSKKVQAGGLNPTQAVEPFNIRVTHEPPKGAAKKPE